MNKYHFDNSIVNGKPAHAHYLNGKKLLGTSTVVGVIDKSGPIRWWASRLAVEHFGWSHPKTNGRRIPMEQRITPEFLDRHQYITNLCPKGYLAECDEAYKAHAVETDSAADKGVALHANLETYIKGCLKTFGGQPMPTGFDDDRVQLFANWAMENVKRFIASEGHCYSERLHTGGIVDLIFEDTSGNLAILDYKSAKAAYGVHFYQMGGYAVAVEENGIFTADGELVMTIDKPFSYYLSLPYRLPNPSPQIGTAEDKELGKNTAKCKRAFELCAELWGIVNGG